MTNYDLRHPAPKTPADRSATTGGGTASPTERRTAALERNSARVVQRAHAAGVNITYLGITPLFSEPCAYGGPKTDWVIGPANDISDAIIPGAERRDLLRLVGAGIEFPMIYVAHEIPKGELSIPATGPGLPAQRPVTVDRAAAERAVGPVPPPVAAAALADSLGRSSHRLLTALRMAAPIVAGIAAAPFLLAGAALAALAAGLDPIVFGVIPAGPPMQGQPAAWYIIARWDWPSTP
jgi:hypothetical protein